MAFASQETIREGDLTRSIEQQTAKVPSLGYLGFALASMAASASLAFIFHRKDAANFIGLWAPTILIMGLYNKVVKIEHESGFSRPEYSSRSATESFSSPTV